MKERVKEGKFRSFSIKLTDEEYALVLKTAKDRNMFKHMLLREVLLSIITKI